MDLQKRAALIERILTLQTSPDTMPVVSLKAFFDGNDDLGSIGCNLPEHPGVQRFYSVLSAIKARSDVQDVLVEIHEIVDDETSWPFADTVYILTAAGTSAVHEWVADLQPDEVADGFRHPPGAPSLLPGMRPVHVWWD